ncbi:hypothetical protein B0H10DRAFT_2055594 [Mycena sp. CBHHK59/15]|nr:hypothetical protein B0H10DRAFT_2055594 [Mycena sp. CBHHK59/15]
MVPPTQPALSGSNPPLFIPQMDAISSIQAPDTSGAERNIIPWPTLNRFLMESPKSGLQPPPLRLQSSAPSVSTSSPEGLAMSFLTFGSDSESVPSVASPGSFCAIHELPASYGQVINIPIDDPFRSGEPLESCDVSDDDFPMSSDVDDTFSFLGRPGTRADANLLWTRDPGASRSSRGSRGHSAIMCLDRPALGAEMLSRTNESFPRPNSPFSDNDMDVSGQTCRIPTMTKLRSWASPPGKSRKICQIRLDRCSAAAHCKLRRRLGIFDLRYKLSTAYSRPMSILACTTSPIFQRLSEYHPHRWRPCPSSVGTGFSIASGSRHLSGAQHWGGKSEQVWHPNGIVWADVTDDLRILMSLHRHHIPSKIVHKTAWQT